MARLNSIGHEYTCKCKFCKNEVIRVSANHDRKSCCCVECCWLRNNKKTLTSK